jgi:hypothetical protein
MAAVNTAIDTNIIIALWGVDPVFSAAAQSALDSALQCGGLVVCPAVFAELMAAPGRDEAFVDAFFRDTGIRVDWTPDERVWRAAGGAFQAYASRRRRQREPGPRRILADFLIGAHAFQSARHLLTLDDRFYKAAFPKLTVTVP